MLSEGRAWNKAFVGMSRHADQAQLNQNTFLWLNIQATNFEWRLVISSLNRDALSKKIKETVTLQILT